MDDQQHGSAKRRPFVEFLVHKTNSNSEKRGRLCNMEGQPMLPHPGPASVCQLGVSNFLPDEIPCSQCFKQETLDLLESLFSDSYGLEWGDHLEQHKIGAQQLPSFQQFLCSCEAYNAITEDKHRLCKHTCFSNVGVCGNFTSTSWRSASSNAQQGKQGEHSSSSLLSNSGIDPIGADNGYWGSRGDCDGSENKNGPREYMENDMSALDLTDDLLHLVFSFLDQKSLCASAMVCRQWRTASAHEDFWKRLSFKGENFTEEKVGWLCCKYSKATELTLSEVPCIDEVARGAMFSLQGLRTLNLHSGILTDSFFTALASGCSALQQLSIMYAKLGTGGSQEVLVCHENLQQLYVIKCRVRRIIIRCPLLNILSLKRTSMASALLHCQKLLSLDVSSCNKLSDGGVRAAATACPTLLILDISQCSYVSDETLREISIACVNLVSLNVSHCPNISLDGFSLPMLKELKLQNCEGINSQSMASLSQCCMLESVMLDWCALLTSVALHLDGLQSLTLTNCRKFADLTLMCPALVDLNIATCAVLEHINISSLALKRLVLPKQISLKTLSLQCPCLSTVDLSECDSLSNSICKVFSDGGGCPRLTSLILDNCENLTAVKLSTASLEFLSLAGCRHMKSLQLACKSLKRLNLDGCDHLTLATFAPVGLQSLNLGICPRVTDLKIESCSMTSLDLKGCGALTQADIYCPQLLSLDAFYCRGLEDKCLEATIISCPLMKSLILASCPSIGPVGLSSLRMLLNLTVLDLSYTFVTYLSPVFDNCPQLKITRKPLELYTQSYKLMEDSNQV